MPRVSAKNREILGLLKVIWLYLAYCPDGKSTMTGESIVIFFFGGGSPLSKSKKYHGKMGSSPETAILRANIGVS